VNVWKYNSINFSFSPSGKVAGFAFSFVGGSSGAIDSPMFGTKHGFKLIWSNGFFKTRAKSAFGAAAAEGVEEVVCDLTVEGGFKNISMININIHFHIYI